MTDRSRPRAAWVLGIGIVALALNLRVAVGSVGVVLVPLREDLGMDATLAGVLTTLPVLCFAAFGATAPRVVRVLGLDRTAVVLLLVAASGLALRAVADSPAAFLALTVLALAGCAVGNVILPALTKEHFPDHIPLVSSLYGAALMGGAALAAIGTVPVADALGGDWRTGIGAWAVLTLAAAVPWLPSLRRAAAGTVRVRPAGIAMGRLLRSPLAWACALCFGVQAAQAYAQFGWFPAIMIDAGLEAGEAGVLLALLIAVGIPGTLLLPTLIRRIRAPAVLPWSFAVLTALGWAGVLVAPTQVPWLWAVLLGLGGCAFTWNLTMFGRRTATAEGTAALSGFAQAVGYAVAGLGPFGTGLLHDLTGGWTVPVAVLMVAGLLIGVFGTLVDRDRRLEDELDPAPVTPR